MQTFDEVHKELEHHTIPNTCALLVIHTEFPFLLLQDQEKQMQYNSNQ